MSKNNLRFHAFSAVTDIRPADEPPGGNRKVFLRQVHTPAASGVICIPHPICSSITRIPGPGPVRIKNLIRYVIHATTDNCHQCRIKTAVQESLSCRAVDYQFQCRVAGYEQPVGRIVTRLLERTFNDSIVSVRASDSMVVIRTLPGTAQAVAFAVDYMKWPEILGSIAGDDTVFIALPNKEAVITLLERFKDYR